MLELIGIKVINGTGRIFNKLDLSFGRGVTGILGLNGSGKTTLLKMIAGLIQPACGKIIYDGLSVSPRSSSWRKRIGYLSQSTAIYEGMKVGEYLNYMLLLSKFSDHSERKKLIDEVLGLFALEGYERELISQLSGGVRQRIGLAQAFVHKPDVLLLDEPVNFLDTFERMRIQNLLLSHFKDRIILYVGHIINEMEVFCSELVILHAQECIFKDKPAALKNYATGRVRCVIIDPDICDVENDPENLILQLFSYDHQLGIKFDGPRFLGQTGVPAEITLQDAYQIYLNDLRGKSC